MSQHKPNIYKSNLCPPCPPSATTFEKCVYWLGIGLGSGLPKRAAGTWGTVGGMLVAVPVMLVFGFMIFVLMTLVGLAIGSYVCGKTSTLMGIDDDPHIVFDEWVGVWLALLPSAWAMGLSLSARSSVWDLLSSEIWLIVIPFVLFRIFDVLKPFPISWADRRVSGGFGIMLDDVLAGIISALLFMSVFFVMTPM